MESLKSLSELYPETWLQSDEVLRARFQRQNLPASWWPSFLKEQKKPSQIFQQAFLEWQFYSPVLNMKFAQKDFFQINPTLTRLEVQHDFPVWQIDKGTWLFFEFQNQKQKFKPTPQQLELLHELEEGLAIAKSNSSWIDQKNGRALIEMGLLV